jgi:hypothetical protein
VSNKNKSLQLSLKTPEDFIREIENIIASEKIDYQNLKNNEKLEQHHLSVMNNNLTKLLDQTEIFKTNEEVLFLKRRTSSFDASIVERFLVKDNNIVLPKVSLSILKDK